MAIFNQNKFFGFAIFVLLLIFGAVFVYAVKPIQSERTKLSDELDRKKQEEKTLLAKFDTAAANDPAKLVQLDRVRRKIPEQPYPEQLLRDMRLMEVSSGIQLKYYNIQPGDMPVASEAAEAGGAAEATANATNAASGDNEAAAALAEAGQYLFPVKVTTEFSGGYVQLYRLLQEAQTMNRLWQVDNVSFSETKPLGAVGVNKPNQAMKVQITFVTYFAPALGAYYNKPLPIDYDTPQSDNIPF